MSKDAVCLLCSKNWSLKYKLIDVKLTSRYPVKFPSQHLSQPPSTPSSLLCHYSPFFFISFLSFLSHFSSLAFRQMICRNDRYVYVCTYVVHVPSIWHISHQPTDLYFSPSLTLLFSSLSSYSSFCSFSFLFSKFCTQEAHNDCWKMVLRGHSVSISQYIFRRQSISFPSHPPHPPPTHQTVVGPGRLFSENVIQYRSLDCISTHSSFPNSTG